MAKEKRQWISGRWVGRHWQMGHYSDRPAPHPIDVKNKRSIEVIEEEEAEFLNRDYGLLHFIDEIEETDPALARQLREDCLDGDLEEDEEIEDAEYTVVDEDDFDWYNGTGGRAYGSHDDVLFPGSRLVEYNPKSWMEDQPHLRTVNTPKNKKNGKVVWFPKPEKIHTTDDGDRAQLRELAAKGKKDPQEMPIIGITSVGTNSAGLGNYISSVRASGGIPVLLVDVSGVENVDGVIIPGGCDISPSTYGEDNRHAHGIDAPRDDLEFKVAKECLYYDVPLLGICRGHQMITVAGGGRLYQDIDHERGNRGLNHRIGGHTHVIRVESGTKVDNLKNRQHIIVNSYHHQATRTLPSGFSVTARAADGVVEAIESETHQFIVGTQYHPEMLSGRKKSIVGKHATRIFNAFIKATKENVALVQPTA